MAKTIEAELTVYRNFRNQLASVQQDLADHDAKRAGLVLQITGLQRSVTEARQSLLDAADKED